MGKTKRPNAAAKLDQKSTKHQARQNKHNRRSLHQLKISDREQCDPGESSLASSETGIFKFDDKYTDASTTSMLNIKYTRRELADFE